MTRYNPHKHAAELGLDIIHRPIRTANAFWMPDHNLIVVRSGLRAVIERSALAHEIGHAELGHFDDSPKHEKAADRYAADRLISPAELRAASRWAPNHAVLASELGVTQRLLDAYLDLQASR